MRQLQQFGVLGFAVILLGLLAACSTTVSADSTNAAQVAYGLKVYTQNYCGTCHALAAAESESVFGPTHNGFALIAPTRLSEANYKGTATTVEGYIRESITAPKADVVEGYEQTIMPMPAFELSDQDIDSLVALLLAQQ